MSPQGCVDKGDQLAQKPEGSGDDRKASIMMKPMMSTLIGVGSFRPCFAMAGSFFHEPGDVVCRIAPCDCYERERFVSLEG